MIKPGDPRDLVLDLIPRSICRVQVASVIVDKDGIFAWGWNHVGNGQGTHAEAHAILRANKARLGGSTIYVAGQRNKGGKTVTAKPCSECQAFLDGRGMDVIYRDGSGIWRYLE